MRKPTFIYFIWILFIPLLFSCNEEKDSSQLQVNWSSQNMYSIPYRLRLQKYDRGNLIVNPGFEEGKYYEFNAKSQPFDILGWKKSSEMVEWVDTVDSEYKRDEVYFGKHSIKIHKPHADETEEKGEGVESDFIRVIPGKYQLSLYVRLDNIKSAKKRLGTRLYDAIDIRMVYFDKNKLEINPNIYSPYYQSFINTSFKGYSFSNFSEIDSLGWTKVYCESAYPPFPDGFVPDNARFVKVFIGLKGSGTLWADNISLTYTRENFNLAEKLSPYFSQEFAPYETLLPSPKYFVKKDPIEFSQPENSTEKNILILHPKTFASSDYIKYLTEQFPGNQVTQKTSIRETEESKYQLILDFFPPLVKDSLAYKHIPADATTYYAISPSINNPKHIYVQASTPSGWWMAVYTIKQLFDTEKQTFYPAIMANWPEMDQHNLIMLDEPKNENIQWPGLNGYSQIYTPANNSERTDFILLTPKSLSLNSGKSKKQATVLLETDKPETFGDVYVEKLNNVINRLKSSGNREVMFFSAWNSLLEIDENRYQNERFIYRNYTLFQKFSGFLWAGTSTVPTQTDQLDLQRMSDLIPVPLAGEQAILPYAIHTDTLHILQEFNPAFGDILKKTSAGQFILLPENSFFLRLETICAMDYFWSTSNYDPEFTLFKALMHHVNQSDAIELIQYSTMASLLYKLVQEKRKNHSMDKWSRQEENIASDFLSSIQSIKASQTLSKDIKYEVIKTGNTMKTHLPATFRNK